MPEKAVLANSVGGARMGLQRHEFRLQPGPRLYAGRIRPQRFLSRRGRRAQYVGTKGRQTLAAMIAAGRDSRPAGRSVCAQGLQDRPRRPRGDRFGRRLRRDRSGATADQIESAIGMVVAHYIPFRAIRAGNQLSDSKGASAAISTEMAVTACIGPCAGFVGPADIFRNPEAIFCLFDDDPRRATPARST